MQNANAVVKPSANGHRNNGKTTPSKTISVSKKDTVLDGLKAEIEQLKKEKAEAEKIAKMTAKNEKQTVEATKELAKHYETLKKEFESLKAEHQAQKPKSIEQVRAELMEKKKLFNRLEELERVKTDLDGLDFNESAARPAKLVITDTENTEFKTHNLSVIYEFVKLVKGKADEHILKVREEIKNA